jgi:hypothetical protein
MSGPKPAYPIHLSPEQSIQLRQLIRAHTTPQTTSLRARIVLAAHDHPDWSNLQIGHSAGTSDRIVRKWRRRWSETQSLADAARPGAPRRFSP